MRWRSLPVSALWAIPVSIQALAHGSDLVTHLRAWPIAAREIPDARSASRAPASPHQVRCGNSGFLVWQSTSIGSPLSMPYGMQALCNISGAVRCAGQLRKLPRSRGKCDFSRISLCGPPGRMMRRKSRCQKITKIGEGKKKKRRKTAKKKQV